MRARITKEYRAAPTGQAMPQTYAVGLVVEGELAHWAVADGHAVEIKDAVPPPREPKGPRSSRAAPPADSDDTPARKA